LIAATAVSQSVAAASSSLKLQVTGTTARYNLKQRGRRRKTKMMMKKKEKRGERKTASQPEREREREREREMLEAQMFGAWGEEGDDLCGSKEANPREFARFQVWTKTATQYLRSTRPEKHASVSCARRALFEPGPCNGSCCHQYHHHLAIILISCLSLSSILIRHQNGVLKT
jgi:hypothetical protein